MRKYPENKQQIAVCSLKAAAYELKVQYAVAAYYKVNRTASYYVEI